jgi:hypothetical protein
MSYLFRRFSQSYQEAKKINELSIIRLDRLRSQFNAARSKYDIFRENPSMAWDASNDYFKEVTAYCDETGLVNYFHKHGNCKNDWFDLPYGFSVCVSYCFPLAKPSEVLNIALYCAQSQVCRALFEAMPRMNEYIITEGAVGASKLSEQQRLEWFRVWDQVGYLERVIYMPGGGEHARFLAALLGQTTTERALSILRNSRIYPHLRTNSHFVEWMYEVDGRLMAA